MNITWSILSFKELTTLQLYNILKLRAKVFIVEQDCPYLDMDDKDQKALHVLGLADDQLIAYSRLLPEHVSYKEPSIGRVVTDPAFRRLKLGKELMNTSIEQLYQHYGKQPIRIGAQLYLKAFYESYGFRQIGEPYDEDGIPHIIMLLD